MQLVSIIIGITLGNICQEKKFERKFERKNYDNADSFLIL